MLRVNGDIYTDNRQLKNHVIDYFRNLFNVQFATVDCSLSIISKVIPILVSNEENFLLNRAPSFDEVKLTAYLS